MIMPEGWFASIGPKQIRHNYVTCTIRTIELLFGVMLLRGLYRPLRLSLLMRRSSSCVWQECNLTPICTEAVREPWTYAECYQQ